MLALVQGEPEDLSSCTSCILFSICRASFIFPLRFPCLPSPTPPPKLITNPGTKGALLAGVVDNITMDACTCLGASGPSGFRVLGFEGLRVSGFEGLRV